MKLVCSQSDLSTNLSLISRAVPSRPTHPVLGNVLLVADEKSQRVSLTAFDLSLGIQTSFPAQVIEGSTITLPAKLLNDIISRLPEGEITLLYEEGDEKNEGALVTLTSASGRYQVRGMGAEEFPDLPVIEEGQALHLPGNALVEGLRGSIFAASTDETKQILTGIHLGLQQDSLEFAATDGHRLAVVETSTEVGGEGEETTPIKNNIEEFAVTIPARALRELERILATRQSKEPVALYDDEGQVIFELGEQRLTSRKLDGQYPAYEQLLPSQFVIALTVERKRLLSSLELVAVLAEQKNSIVKFTLDSEAQQLSLSVDAQDVGSAKESMPAQISGESIEVAFNVKYVLDSLKVLNATEITMQMNTSDSPVILTPLGGVKMTHLVMPVQIRG
ncbi:MAG: DNA polymerase III subunit beta [Spirulinaceae cyanobacterium]